MTSHTKSIPQKCFFSQLYKMIPGNNKIKFFAIKTDKEYIM